MKIESYNQKGEAVGKIELPAEIFEIEINHDLVYQAMVAQQANSRKIIAHTKDRSERRGGGAKPWRQKGTGRARHGSNRSPIWRKGGITFGPTNRRNYTKKINQKMKRKALFMSLSSKVQDKELILLNKLELAEIKTKQMQEILDKLSKKTKQALKSNLIVAPETNKNLILSSRNLPKTRVIRADSLNLVDVLKYKNLILLQDSIKVIEKTYLK